MFVTVLAYALRMPSPMWINVAPEKSFQSLRSIFSQRKQSIPQHVHSFVTMLLVINLNNINKEEEEEEEIVN